MSAHSQSLTTHANTCVYTELNYEFPKYLKDNKVAILAELGITIEPVSGEKERWILPMGWTVEYHNSEVYSIKDNRGYYRVSIQALTGQNPYAKILPVFEIDFDEMSTFNPGTGGVYGCVRDARLPDYAPLVDEQWLGFGWSRRGNWKKVGAGVMEGALSKKYPDWRNPLAYWDNEPDHLGLLKAEEPILGLNDLANTAVIAIKILYGTLDELLEHHQRFPGRKSLTGFRNKHGGHHRIIDVLNYLVESNEASSRSKLPAFVRERRSPLHLPWVLACRSTPHNSDGAWGHFEAYRPY